MFEVGFSEVLVIMALALIVLGPEKLPKVASQVGRWMGRARAMARQFRETLEEEVQLEPTVRRPGASSAGEANSAAAAAPVATAAAAAGGLVAAATDHDPAAGSHIPYSDAGYSSASGDDADTRHNEYTGAAYTPPDTPVDPLAPAVVASTAPYAEPPSAAPMNDPGVEAPRPDFDANFDPTAPIAGAHADPHGQRGT